MSLRDRLSSLRRRTEVFSFPLEDPGPAQHRLQQAQAALLLAEARHPVDPDDPDAEPHEDVRRLRRQVELADEEVRACFGYVTFQAIDSDVMERIAQEAAEQRKDTNADEDDDDPDYDMRDPNSYVMRLIAASVVVPDGEERMSEKDWVEVLNGPEWTAQYRMELAGKAMLANSRHAYDVGKGFGGTRR